MNPSEKPAAGMHLFYLDGAGILFSETTQELHLLNTTAAVIWSLLEEGHDAQATIAALQEMHGLDAERSEQFVVAALAEWRQRALPGRRISALGRGSNGPGGFPAAPATPVAPDQHRRGAALSNPQLTVLPAFFERCAGADRAPCHRASGSSRIVIARDGG